jgi:hypothetical protein
MYLKAIEAVDVEHLISKQTWDLFKWDLTATDLYKLDITWREGTEYRNLVAGAALRKGWSRWRVQVVGTCYQFVINHLKWCSSVPAQMPLSNFDEGYQTCVRVLCTIPQGWMRFSMGTVWHNWDVATPYKGEYRNSKKGEREELVWFPICWRWGRQFLQTH